LPVILTPKALVQSADDDIRLDSDEDTIVTDRKLDVEMLSPNISW